VLNKFFPSDQAITPRSLDLMITGSIPPGSGLSSSAALIVASLLSILLGNELISSSSDDQAAARSKVTNADLVQMAREAEAKIGVNSGGMDQSASVLSRAGQGLYVSFAPELEVENVKLPDVRLEDGSEESLVMVITNSLTRHDLSRGAEKEYNLRVMETLIGARILGHKLGLLSTDKGEDERLQLRTVLGRFGGETKDKILSADELEKAISSILPEVDNHLGSPKGLLPSDLAPLMGMSEDESTTFQSQMKVNTSDQDGRFRVQMRVKHVFEEARRVLAVRRICLESAGAGAGASSSSGLAGESNVQEIGRLMNESHESCDKLYECSNSELNELVQVCREAGSVGSRLSG
jgi:galactokinase